MQEQLHRPGGRESASGRRRSAGGQAPRRQMNLKEAIRPARTVSGAALCGTRPRAVPSHGDRVLPLGVQYPAPLALFLLYPGTGTGGSCSTLALGGVLQYRVTGYPAVPAVTVASHCGPQSVRRAPQTRRRRGAGPRPRPLARAADRPCCSEGRPLTGCRRGCCARSRLFCARSHLRPIALTTISTYARRFSLRSVPTHVHASGA